jgi:glycosyltransferase involved in cell wall biosynthesis
MNRSEVTISVVIPAFNAERYLQRCLASVFAQTLPPNEVIVVDDGSTDNTAKLAEQLGAKVVRRPNGGLSAARNTGIQNASGNWIALLDADDSWEPEKLARQVAAIGPDTVLVYTGIRYFDDNGTRSLQRPMEPHAAKKALRYCNPIPCTYLVRREALLRDGGYREDIRACEDWEMNFRLSKIGSFEAVADPLMHCYLHSDSLSADPDVMLSNLDVILDTTLLADLRGVRRWAWRRRILAWQLSSAALIARDNKLKSELGYFVRSLLAWPSPFWQPRRFACLAVSARNALRSSWGGGRPHHKEKHGPSPEAAPETPQPALPGDPRNNE